MSYYIFEKRFNGPNPEDYHIYMIGSTTKRIPETNVDYVQFLAGGGEPTIIPYVPPTLDKLRLKALSDEHDVLHRILHTDFISSIERDGEPLVFSIRRGQFAEIEASGKAADATVSDVRVVRDADLKVWEITREEQRQLLKERALYIEQHSCYSMTVAEELNIATTESGLELAEDFISSYHYAPVGFVVSGGVVNTEALLAETKATLPGSGIRAVVQRDQFTTMFLFAEELSSEDEATLDGVVAAHTGTPPLHPATETEYWATDPIVTDSLTGKSAPFSIMQPNVNRRELFNDEDNPVYLPGHTPLLGPNGSVQKLNDIHDKLGWHRQQVKQATYQRPTDLLVYYGYPSAFNNGDNGWNNEKVAQDMSRYGLIVLGNGLQESSHPDYANTQEIITRIRILNPKTKIFGYVTVSRDFNSFESKANEWDSLHVDGVFMDEAGYEYGTVATNGREALNAKIEHVHGNMWARLCFVNSWNVDHVIGTGDDPGHLNSTYNPGLEESSLTEDDWYLLESFPVNTAAYGSGGYESKLDWAVRGVKAQGHRATHGINLAAVGIINNDNADGQDLFDFLFVSSLMFSLDAMGSSDTNYGANPNATVARWLRPDVSNMGTLYSLNASVQEDVNDANVYWRYVDHGRFKLGFEAGSEVSLVEKY